MNTGEPDCNGKFKYLSVTGKKLHELEYQDGRLKSFGNFKDSSINKGTARTNFCIDWYWVSTWYDEYGNQVAQNWEYYGSTCQGEDCEDPYNAMLCPMEYPGSGAGTPEGYEYTVTRPVTWEIAISSSNIWRAMSTEQVSGTKVANEPQGGHFTSITHQTSFLQYGDNFVWQELSNTATLDDSRTARSYTQGKATYSPTGWYVTVNNSLLASFQTLFP